MSENEELEQVRAEKRAEIEQQLAGDATETPDEPIYIDGGDHLTDIVETNDIVLVDFHADWCGPCQMLAPVVEELAAETEAAVAKVDIDANQQLAARHNVQGVPTLLLFADGELVERIVGVRDKSNFAQLIDSHASN